MRRRRLAGCLLAGFLLTVVVGWLLSRSAITARYVAGRLTAELGTTVHIDWIEIGITGLTLHHVQLADPDASTPWLQTQRLDADVSLLRLLTGSIQPSRLVLHEVEARLRFDAHDELLTPMPQLAGSGSAARPMIEVRQARLVVQQAGREEWAIAGIDATLSPHANGFIGQGTIHDPIWGRWNLDMEAQPETSTGLLRLTADEARRVTQAMLRSLPFVGLHVWDQVQADGWLAGALTVQVDPRAEHPVSYTVEATVHDARVFVSALPLTGTRTRGLIRLQNGLLTLKTVSAEAMGGLVRISGELDFRGEADHLNFVVIAENLDVAQLPPDWGLTGHVGRLNGSADLRLTVQAGHIHTDGSGEATVTGATIAGFPTTLKLRLLPAGRGQWHLVPQPRAAWASVLVGVLADLPKPAAQIEATFTLDQVDVVELIRQLKIELPITAEGRMSVEVRAIIPTDTPRDRKTYRVNGQFRFPRLTLQGLPLEDVTGLLDYRDTLLRIEEATAKIGQGRIHLQARLGTEPPHDLTFAIALTDANLSAVFASLGTINGRAEGHGTLDPPKLSARLELPKLEWNDIAAERVTGRVDWHNDRLDYRLNGDTLGGKLLLEGHWPLAGRGRSLDGSPGTGRLSIRGVRLGRVVERFRLPRVWRPLDGEVTLDYEFRPGSTGQMEGLGRFQIDRLQWRLTEISPRLRGVLTWENRLLRIREFSAELGGGTARGFARIPLQPDRPAFLTLTLDRVSAHRVLADALNLGPGETLPLTVAGQLNARLRARVGREVTGSGTITAGQLTIERLPFTEVRLPLTWLIRPRDGGGEIRLREATARLTQGSVQGEAVYSFGGVGRLDGSVRFAGCDMHSLLRAERTSAALGVGQASGRIDFSGSEIRSFDDVTASLQATLGRTQPLGLPVLREMALLLRLRSLTETFETGEVRAALSRGLIRVQRFTLEGPVGAVLHRRYDFAQRRVEPTRLGRHWASPLLGERQRLLARRLPPGASALPVVVTADAARLLASRVIELDVDGTIQKPSVELRPLRTLSGEAARFFLGLATLGR